MQKPSEEKNTGSVKKQLSQKRKANSIPKWSVDEGFVVERRRTICGNKRRIDQLSEDSSSVLGQASVGQLIKSIPSVKTPWWKVWNGKYSAPMLDHNTLAAVSARQDTLFRIQKIVHKLRDPGSILLGQIVDEEEKFSVQSFCTFLEALIQYAHAVRSLKSALSQLPTDSQWKIINTSVDHNYYHDVSYESFNLWVEELYHSIFEEEEKRSSVLSPLLALPSSRSKFNLASPQTISNIVASSSASSSSASSSSSSSSSSMLASSSSSFSFSFSANPLPPPHPLRHSSSHEGLGNVGSKKRWDKGPKESDVEVLEPGLVKQPD